MRTWPASCLVGVLAATLPAQTTLLVGPGGMLPQIRDALQIAVPGDRIVVVAGTYAHFTAQVGVTIQALVPGTVSVTWQQQFVPGTCLANPQCLANEGPTVLAPPPGQTLHVTGIDFLPNIFTGTAVVRHRVVVTSGTVTMDQCTVQATGAVALTVQNASLHLQDCAIAGIGGNGAAHGLLATNATVTAIDSAIAGNTGAAATPGDGVQLNAAVLHGSNLQIYGGSTTQGIGAPALRGSPAAQVWLCDSTLVATNQCPVVPNGATGRITRCTQTSSIGGCTTLPTGTMLGASRLTPPQGGSAFTLRFRGDPFGFLLVLVGPDLAAVSIPGLFDQPLSLSLANVFTGGAYLLDATGNLSVTWTMPAGTPFVGRPVWLQAAGGLTFPMPLSPPAGGIVR